MRFDARAVSILQNFATINKGLIFPPGNTLYTIFKKKLRAKATISTEIEREFAIADLARFLGVLRLFKEPTVEIGEKTLIVSEGEKTVEYVYADSRLIDAPPTQDIKFNADVNFALSARTLKELRDAASVFQHQEMVIIGEKGGVFLETRNVENVTSDRFRVKVGETPHAFSLVVKMDILRMLLADDYEAEVGFKKIVRLKKKDELEYLLAVEAKGTVVPLEG